MRVDGKPVFHLVASIDRPDVRLTDFDVGSWVWARLREAFPRALGTCVMPDHPHVVTPSDDPDTARGRLARILGDLARRLGLRTVGVSAPPKLVRDRKKLLRDLRYVGLQAPRDGFADDPLSWWFSTHRDVVGAVTDPWIDAERLAAALGRPRAGFEAWYHHYVSAAPEVDVCGTALPVPATPTSVAVAPLHRIVRAAAAANRCAPAAIRVRGVCRDQFVRLAHEQGWTNLDQIAAACDCSPRSIRRLLDRPPVARLDAPRLCLGDRRLLAPVG
jgi:hypothetical protein